MDLSKNIPNSEHSVNTCLHDEECTVQYTITKELITTAQAVGTSGYAWAKDLKNGYYNVPIMAEDYLALGFR